MCMCMCMCMYIYIYIYTYMYRATPPAAHHQAEDTKLGQALLCVVFTDCSLRLLGSKLHRSGLEHVAFATPYHASKERHGPTA